MPQTTPSPSAGLSIASGELSGEQSTTVDLGKHQLAGRIWVAWVLTGPEDARATFSLKLFRADGMSASTTLGPVSFGISPSSDDQALSIWDLEPGTYRVLFGQTVQPTIAPGYSVEYEVFTTP